MGEEIGEHVVIVQREKGDEGLIERAALSRQNDAARKTSEGVVQRDEFRRAIAARHDLLERALIPERRDAVERATAFVDEEALTRPLATLSPRRGERGWG